MSNDGSYDYYASESLGSTRHKEKYVFFYRYVYLFTKCYYDKFAMVTIQRSILRDYPRAFCLPFSKLCRKKTVVPLQEYQYTNNDIGDDTFERPPYALLVQPSAEGNLL